GVVAPDSARGAHSPATMGPWRALAGRTPSPSTSMPPPPSSIAQIYTLQCCLRLLERRVRSQELNGDPSFKAKAVHRSASAWGCLLQLQPAIGQQCNSNIIKIQTSCTVYYPARAVPF
ncbi:hypothetical protein PVAP13_2KG468905, partial [Panicum virgatum]